jgi:hypothetical protein
MLTEPEGEIRGMLSGEAETTAGRVGVTAKAMGWAVPPFWRWTVIESELGDVLAKYVPGIIARIFP